MRSNQEWPVEKRAVPNAATVAALKEAEHSGGKVYRGSSREIIDAMLRDAPRLRLRASG
jgi:hypothetical protein